MPIESGTYRKSASCREAKIQLEPGQFVTGRHAAAAELGMAPSTTWDYLKLLEAQECISIKSNNKFSVVTVVNWAFYQGCNENFDSKIDNKSKANGQQIDTINNVNNDNNVKNKRNKNKKSVSNKDDETIKAQDARSGRLTKKTVQENRSRMQEMRLCIFLQSLKRNSG